MYVYIDKLFSMLLFVKRIAAKINSEIEIMILHLTTLPIKFPILPLLSLGFVTDTGGHKSHFHDV